MDLGLRDKVALVAAGSKGIGRAVAHGLATEGCRVAICAREATALRRTAAEIADATGTDVLAVLADVTKPEEIDRYVATTLDRFGGIDILFNNAGGPPPGTFDEIDDAQWERAFQLNLMSGVRLMRAVLPSMRERGGGRIISLTSSAVKEPIDGLLLSNSIRMGVVGLSKTLAREVGPDNITVNVIAQGRVLTDRLRSLYEDRARRPGAPWGANVEEILAADEAATCLKRLASPEEIANAAVFLASDAASYITSTVIVVDGGLLRGV